MRRFMKFAIAAVFAGLIAGCATPSSMPSPAGMMPPGPTRPPQASNAQGPWISAGALVAATGADVQRRGIQGIAPHVQDLEKALAEGKPLFGANPSNPGIILTDGPGESLIILL